MEDDFISAILDAPGDEASFLVYADWLEERGDPRGEFLRIESEFLSTPLDDAGSPALMARLRELHHTLDPDWVALVRRVLLDPLDELRAILPPPKRPFGATGNWELVEKALGLNLPADYKAFHTVYGGGTVGCIDIPSPFGVGTEIRRWWEGWAAYYRDVAEYEEVPCPVFPEPGGLLPFGTLGDVDSLNWLTVGEPDRWVFVYHDREEGFFDITGLSAVEFVLEVVTQRSPLLTRLRSVSEFDPPCEFVPQMVEPQIIWFVSHRDIDLRSLTEQLASRWPADQVRIRLSATGASLRVEPLAGSIGFNTDTGDERTFATISYDEAYAIGVQQTVQDLLNAGFAELDS